MTIEVQEKRKRVRAVNAIFHSVRTPLYPFRYDGRQAVNCMKTVIICVVMVLCICKVAHADWEQVRRFNFLNEYSVKVYFVDQQHGWYYGGTPDFTKPVLGYTDDGGTTSWISKFVDDELAYIWDICFVNDSVGWLVGESKDNTGLIFKTEDGGDNWQFVLESKDIYKPKKVVFPTALIGYVFSTDYDDQGKESAKRAICKTTDGGKTWHINTLDKFDDELEGKFFVDAFFINADIGWIVGGSYERRGFVMRTINGGDSWDLYTDIIEGMTVAFLSSVYFVDEQNGWIGGYHTDNGAKPFLAYTEDGGSTWEFIDESFEYSSIMKVHFFDNNTGWVVTSKNLYFTDDNAKNLEVTSVDSMVIDSYLDNIYILDENHAWAMLWTNASATVRYLFKLVNNNASIKYNNLHNTSQLMPMFNMNMSSNSKNGIVKFIYTLRVDALLSISIYDLKGKRVAHHPKVLRTAGKHNLIMKLPKGFYVVEAKVFDGKKDGKFTKKLFVR